MRTALTACLFLVGCSFVELNPKYCDETISCPSGKSCDVPHHRCYDPSDPNDPNNPNTPNNPNASPLLTGLDPKVDVPAGGVQVTVQGQGFQSGMQVVFGGMVLDTTYVSSTQLRFTAPASPGLCGPSTVTVQSAAGTPISGQASFHYRLNTLRFTLAMQSMPEAVTATGIAFAPINPGMDELMDYVVSYSTPPYARRYVSDGGAYAFTDFGVDSYQGVFLQDVDGDSNIDAIFRSDTSIDGFQNLATRRPLGRASTALGLGDENGDGRQDLFVFDGMSQQVLLTRLQAGFSYGALEPILTVEDTGKAIVVDDINGDGKLDVAVGVSSKQHVAYALGQGNGVFVAEMPFAVLGSPDFLGAADLDGDGKKELIIATYSMSGGELLVKRHVGGSILEDFMVGIPPDLRVMVLQDMDCDGLIDIVLHHSGMAQIDIYKNLGNRTFSSPPTSIDISGDAAALNFASFTRNARPDLVLVRTNGRLVSFTNDSQ